MPINVYSQDDLTNSLKSLYESDQYDQIISEHSGNIKGYSAKAIYYVAMAYYMKADDINCLKFMDLSIKKDKTDPDPFFIKGMTYNYLGQFERAIESINKAIDLDSKNSKFYSGLGDSYFSLTNYPKALEAYETATKKENPIDRAFMMIPQVFLQLNNSQSALKSFYTAKEKISKEKDSYTTVLYNIGLSELLIRNYDKAEIALKELIDLSPSDYHAYSKLIQIYYGKQEYEKAKPYREKLYEAYKQSLLNENLKEMFCFDQFDWEDKLIQAFERFEEKEGELYYKHLFYVMNDKNKIESRIQTENSPFSIESGGAKYLLGMDKNGTHSTYDLGFDEDFNYQELKIAVIKILEQKVQPSASSSPGK